MSINQIQRVKTVGGNVALINAMIIKTVFYDGSRSEDTSKFINTQTDYTCCQGSLNVVQRHFVGDTGKSAQRHVVVRGSSRPRSPQDGRQRNENKKPGTTTTDYVMTP